MTQRSGVAHGRIPLGQAVRGCDRIAVEENGSSALGKSGVCALASDRDGDPGRERGELLLDCPQRLGSGRAEATARGPTATTARSTVERGVSAPRNTMRQPASRSGMPNSRRGRSCCSPGGQASSAIGAVPRPQPRARPRRRPRRTLLAKCSCAMVTCPAAQLSPSECSTGMTMSTSTASVLSVAKRAVENPVCGLLVETYERFLQRGSRLGGACGRCDVCAVALLEALPEPPGGREACPLDDSPSDERVPRRPPSRGEPAAGTDRLQQPVPTLPGAEELGCDAYSAAQFADPELPVARVHAISVQSLDKHLTRTSPTCTKPGRTLWRERMTAQRGTTPSTSPGPGSSGPNRTNPDRKRKDETSHEEVDRSPEVAPPSQLPV